MVLAEIYLVLQEQIQVCFDEVHHDADLGDVHIISGRGTVLRRIGFELSRFHWRRNNLNKFRCEILTKHFHTQPVQSLHDLNFS